SSSHPYPVPVGRTAVPTGLTGAPSTVDTITRGFQRSSERRLGYTDAESAESGDVLGDCGERDGGERARRRGGRRRARGPGVAARAVVQHPPRGGHGRRTRRRPHRPGHRAPWGGGRGPAGGRRAPAPERRVGRAGAA